MRHPRIFERSAFPNEYAGQHEGTTVFCAVSFGMT